MSPVTVSEFINTANDCQISPLSLTSGFATNLNIGHVSDFLCMVFIFILFGSIISNEPQRWYRHSGDLYGTATIPEPSHLDHFDQTGSVTYAACLALVFSLTCVLNYVFVGFLALCVFTCVKILSHEDQNRWSALHHSSLCLVYNLALIQCVVYGRYLTNTYWMTDWMNGAGLHVS